MIALLRRNLTTHNPFLCKSVVSLSLPVHFFSTKRKKQDLICPWVYGLLLHKYHFSPEVATQAALNVKGSGNADSVLSFLEQVGFSNSQLERTVKYKPIILSASVGKVKSKIKIFQDLNFSSEEIGKIISSSSTILHLSVENKIIPSITLLKGLLGSDHAVARLLRKSVWFLYANLENCLFPNVEFLKSCGIPMEHIVSFVYTSPRCSLIKPDLLKQAVDMAKEMGFSQSEKMFFHAVRNIAYTSKEGWEMKLQAFRDLGFSDSEVLTMCRKAPVLFGLSMKKIKKVKEFLEATGKFDRSSIVQNPSSLGSSIEKRLEPRLRILGILESRKLIKKLPGLAVIYSLSDDKFFEKFIGPCVNEIGDVYIAQSCVEGKE